MRKSWVAFIDILGFSSLVKEATERGKANELLDEVCAALNEAKADLVVNPEDYAKYGIQVAPYAVKMFTDNVVLGFPIHDDGEGEFGRMIYIVGLWQYTLLKHGFFVRGGITVGPIFMNDDVVFGKGLLDAYETESTLARAPRVVLAPAAMDLVHHHLAYYAKVSESPHNVSLLVDADSQMFLNSLQFPIEEAEGLPDDFKNDLAHHRDLVIARLQEFSANPGIWSKYAWVGSYHNHFCTHLSGAEDLKIDSALLNQPPRFLEQLYARKGQKMFRGGEEVATLKYLTQWEVEKEPE
ncbi:MAG: hypothetical protein H0X25_14345 [Acidobacteriales bacterium]|nr:hypothetical protein [Terriglobales bacterium]